MIVFLSSTLYIYIILPNPGYTYMTSLVKVGNDSVLPRSELLSFINHRSSIFSQLIPTIRQHRKSVRSRLKRTRKRPRRHRRRRKSWWHRCPSNRSAKTRTLPCRWQRFDVSDDSRENTKQYGHQENWIRIGCLWHKSAEPWKGSLIKGTMLSFRFRPLCMLWFNFTVIFWSSFESGAPGEEIRAKTGIKLKYICIKILCQHHTITKNALDFLWIPG